MTVPHKPIMEAQIGGDILQVIPYSLNGYRITIKGMTIMSMEEDILSSCITSMFRRGSRVTTAFLNRRIAGLLTATQLSIMAAIKHNPGLNGIALANLLGMERSGLNHVLETMVEHQLISRTTKPGDTRSIFYNISLRGEGVYRQATKEWVAANKALSTIIGNHTKLLKESIALLEKGLEKFK